MCAETSGTGSTVVRPLTVYFYEFKRTLLLNCKSTKWGPFRALDFAHGREYYGHELADFCETSYVNSDWQLTCCSFYAMC